MRVYLLVLGVWVVRGCLQFHRVEPKSFNPNGPCSTQICDPLPGLGLRQQVAQQLGIPTAFLYLAAPDLYVEAVNITKSDDIIHVTDVPITGIQPMKDPKSFEVVQSTPTVWVVQFSHGMCTSCLRFDPIFQEVAEQLSQADPRLYFGRADVQEEGWEGELAERLGILKVGLPAIRVIYTRKFAEKGERRWYTLVKDDHTVDELVQHIKGVVKGLPVSESGSYLKVEGEGLMPPIDLPKQLLEGLEPDGVDDAVEYWEEYQE